MIRLRPLLVLLLATAREETTIGITLGNKPSPAEHFAVSDNPDARIAVGTPNSPHRSICLGEYIAGITKFNSALVNFPATPADFLAPCRGKILWRILIQTLDEALSDNCSCVDDAYRFL